MATVNYVSKTNLASVWSKISELFVRKELKTDSESEYKVLSDNNLTDELLAKIQNAGDSSFTGSYADLTSKPSIEGNEVQAGNQTAASLGLATPSDIATTQSETQTWVQEQGYQTATNVSDAIAEATSGMATQSWVSSQGYQTSSDVSSAITTATAGMATQTWVEGQDYQTASDVSSAIASAVSGVYTPKGSLTFSDLPTPSADALGSVYNVTDAFTTDSTFVEGSGVSYPAGTNVVVVQSGSSYMWDALSGIVDLSGYLQESDLVALTDDEISTICS